MTFDRDWQLPSATSRRYAWRRPCWRHGLAEVGLSPATSWTSVWSGRCRRRAGSRARGARCQGSALTLTRPGPLLRFDRAASRGDHLRRWPSSPRRSGDVGVRNKAADRNVALAANALVASFLGAATIRGQGLEALGWIALVALVLGLCASAVLLAPWQLKFAVDARELYEQASAEADADTLGWLAAAGYGYQSLREENADKVRLMSLLSGAVGILMIAQTIAWLAALAVK